MNSIFRNVKNLKNFNSLLSRSFASNKQVNVGLLGVPLDLGGNWPTARGVDMGPAAFRTALQKTSNLQEALDRVAKINDFGDIKVPRANALKPKDTSARFVEEISTAAVAVRDQIQLILKEKLFPVIVGGDHSLSAGSLAGINSAYNGNIGVIWIDAHADFNTPESSPSGNVHGMPLAAACGRGHPLLVDQVMKGEFVSESKVVLLGLRDVDENEKVNLANSNVTCFTMSDIDRMGVNECMNQAIEIASNGTEGFHCSFDLDSIDPIYAPGVGTPVRGGLTYREAHLAAEKMHASGNLLSIDFVEINPLLDVSNETACLAVELMLSSVGKTTL